MTLTTQPVDAAAAHAMGLADDVRADPAVPVRQLAFRAGKLDTGTIGSLKRYARTLHPITAGTRDAAVTELARLMELPTVRGNLAAFAEHGRFPWQG
jgi:polyketide biosynthesis enoyl-CoA hydratase PksH